MGVGARGVRGGPAPQRAGAALGRVRRLPLVPRDGPRVVRGPRDRRGHERALRQHQGRPRGASRRGRGLHAGHHRDDRARGLADDLCARPRREPVLRRHLLPRRAAARPAVLPAGAGRDRGGLAGPPRGGTPRRRQPARAPQPAGGRDRRADGEGRARRRRADPGPGVRRGGGRVRWRPEVPAVDGAGVPASTRGRGLERPGPADARRDARGDGPRRHLRPARRRLRALLRGPLLGGAALREDALRQRPAARRLRPLGHRDRRPRRPRDRGLPGPRAAHRRGRLRLRARRRQRGRRGQVLRLDAGPAGRGARRAGRQLGGAGLRGDRRRHVRARRLHPAAAPGPRRDGPRPPGRRPRPAPGGPLGARPPRARRQGRRRLERPRDLRPLRRRRAAGGAGVRRRGRGRGGAAGRTAPGPRRRPRHPRRGVGGATSRAA